MAHIGEEKIQKKAGVFSDQESQKCFITNWKKVVMLNTLLCIWAQSVFHHKKR